MAEVCVSVFDDSTDELVRFQVLPTLAIEDVRNRWGHPVGEIPLSDDDLAFLADRGIEVHVGDGEVAFIGARQSFDGERITEPDGETWYPPP